MKYIFLDFDGVLHGSYSIIPFEHSRKLCEKLLPYKDKFKVVISSSWREERSFVVLKQSLKYGLSDNVVGVTPIFKNTAGYGIRHLEILDYCKIYGIEEKDWIAVDDRADFFKPDISNLILTNKKTGISDENIEDIIKFITN